MTITAASPTFVQIPGNSNAEVFAAPMKCFSATDVLVGFITGGVYTLQTSGYSITNVDTNGGFNVVFLVPPPTGTTVDIRTQTPQTQGTEFANLGSYLPENTTEAMDRVTRALQDAYRQTYVFGIHGPDTDSVPWNALPNAAGRALQYLGFDGAGNPIVVQALPGSQMTQGVFDALEFTSIPFLNIYDPVVLGSAGPNLTPGQAFANLGGINMGAETTITAATAFTLANLGRSYLLADSGSPAPYTITLPAGAPVGSIVQIRIASVATQLYTIAGNDVGIDGDPTRIMWRNETCLLFRETNNWAKIGGRTVPFRGCLQSAGPSQSIASGTSFTPAALGIETGDTYALNLCLDTVNNRFKCPRHSSFHFTGNLVLAATVSVSNATCGAALTRNSTSAITTIPCTLQELTYIVGQALQQLICTGTFAMNAGDYLNLIGRIYNGTIASPVFDYVGGSYVPSLSYEEIPLW